MQEDVYASLYEVEDRHWWFRGKRSVVRRLLDRATRNIGRPRVADVGCGCGAMLMNLRDRYDAVGLDASPLAREFCAKRGLSTEAATLPDGLPDTPEAFDAVLLLDVIEHIEDDAATVRESMKLLKPGGVMIATSPAYPWLWSAWDELHHHYRRYTRKQFRELFTGAGMTIERCSYYNSTLLPLAIGQRLVSKLRPPPKSAAMNVPVAPINGLFFATFAAEKFVLPVVPLPWGLSVIAVARKPR